MIIKLELELNKGSIKLAQCSGEIKVRPIGGDLTEKITPDFIKRRINQKIVDSLKSAGFCGYITIDGKKFKI